MPTHHPYHQDLQGHPHGLHLPPQQSLSRHSWNSSLRVAAAFFTRTVAICCAQNMLFVAATSMCAAILSLYPTLTTNDITQLWCCQVTMSKHRNRNTVQDIPSEPSDIGSFIGWDLLVCRFPQMSPQHMQQQVGWSWRKGLDFMAFLLLGELHEAGRIHRCTWLLTIRSDEEGLHCLHKICPRRTHLTSTTSLVQVCVLASVAPAIKRYWRHFSIVLGWRSYGKSTASKDLSATQTSLPLRRHPCSLMSGGGTEQSSYANRGSSSIWRRWPIIRRRRKKADIGMTDEYSVHNVHTLHGPVPNHFVATSMLIKINITCKDRCTTVKNYGEKTSRAIFY